MADYYVIRSFEGNQHQHPLADSTNLFEIKGKSKLSEAFIASFFVDKKELKQNINDIFSKLKDEKKIKLEYGKFNFLEEFSAVLSIPKLAERALDISAMANERLQSTPEYLKKTIEEKPAGPSPSLENP